MDYIYIQILPIGYRILLSLLRGEHFNVWKCEVKLVM